MPNYEYQCTECNHLFEIWQNVGDAPPACPECGSGVKKIFHPPRVIFKGSGFYVTDLRAEQAAKSGGKNGKSESSGSGETNSSSSESSTPAAGDSAKSDSKSETKTESAPAAASSTNSSTDKK